MPESIKGLRLRIRSIRTTRKITRAMEMVSAAKLRKTEGLMKSARPFLQKIESLLGRLAQSERAREHPLFQPSTSGVPILVVFSSDRGLCGAFNANIMRIAVKVLNENPEMVVYAIGRKGRDFLRRYFRDRVVMDRVDLGNRLDGSLTDGIGDLLQQGFLSGKYSRVELLYPHFVSTSTNRPKIERYLPLEATSFGSGGKEIDYALEPSPDRVFEAILPRFLKSKIYLVLAETYTSEHSSRMLAMNAATKNCGELIDSLTLRMNKARQASITKEIIEIVSGAEAAQA